MTDPLSSTLEIRSDLHAIKQWLLTTGGSTLTNAADLEVNTLELDVDTLEIVAGDASPRKYYRVLTRDKSGSDSPTDYFSTSFIVMDCLVDDSMHDFIALAESMRKAEIRTPKIFAADLQNGYMLLEDFGSQLVKAELSLNSGDTIFGQDILPVLDQIKNCDTHALPIFDAERLRSEMQLFVEWFCNIHRESPLSSQDTKDWSLLTDLLIANALEQRQVFVHRDFHCCNVMRLKEQSIGVIDFQDAVLGPASYDLASWIWDRYIDWPREQITRWIEQARPLLAPETDPQLWQKQCDWMGLQRNLKIIGIFCRLNYRDGKKEYMQLIPQFAQYAIDSIERYPELSAVGHFVSQRIAYLTEN